MLLFKFLTAISKSKGFEASPAPCANTNRSLTTANSPAEGVTPLTVVTGGGGLTLVLLVWNPSNGEQAALPRRAREAKLAERTEHTRSCGAPKQLPGRFVLSLRRFPQRSPGAFLIRSLVRSLMRSLVRSVEEWRGALVCPRRPRRASCASSPRPGARGCRPDPRTRPSQRAAFNRRSDDPRLESGQSPDPVDEANASSTLFSVAGCKSSLSLSDAPPSPNAGRDCSTGRPDLPVGAPTAQTAPPTPSGASNARSVSGRRFKALFPSDSSPPYLEGLLKSRPP